MVYCPRQCECDFTQGEINVDSDSLSNMVPHVMSGNHQSQHDKPPSRHVSIWARALGAILRPDQSFRFSTRRRRYRCRSDYNSSQSRDQTCFIHRLAGHHSNYRSVTHPAWLNTNGNGGKRASSVMGEEYHAKGADTRGYGERWAGYTFDAGYSHGQCDGGREKGDDGDGPWMDGKLRGGRKRGEGDNVGLSWVQEGDIGRREGVVVCLVQGGQVKRWVVFPQCCAFLCTSLRTVFSFYRGAQGDCITLTLSL